MMFASKRILLVSIAALALGVWYRTRRSPSNDE